MSSTIKVNNIQNLAGDDSGIDLSTNDQIILKTANTTAITVNSSQNTTFSGDVTIGDASASDSKILFDGNAQDYHIGLDDSADSLIIGKGSALGTTTSMAIDANGIITKPLQPAFLAKVSSDQTNIALNSNITVVFGTERFDNNGDFASNTFTAPVTGKYQLNVSVYLQQVDSSATYIQFRLVTSNLTYQFVFDPDFGQDAQYWASQISQLVDMDASDTAYVTFTQSGGSAQADIVTASYFSGYLVA